MKRKVRLFQERREITQVTRVARACNERKPSLKAAPVRNAALVGLIRSVFVPAAAADASGGATTPHASAGHAILSAKIPRSDGTVGKAAARAMRRGYLVANQAA